MGAGDPAAQRRRARSINGGKGSSGAYTKILDMERKDFEEEILPIADHVCDMQGVIVQGSVSQGGFTIGMAVPMCYAHDALESAIASKVGTVFIRVYLVPPPALDDEDVE
jgi:hypothetical protein